jgi:hypothetical protein
VIANAKAGVRTVCDGGVFNQQPLEMPFNTQGIVTNVVLMGRFLIVTAPPAKEVCHVGQGSTEDRLYLKAFHVLFVPPFEPADRAIQSSLLLLASILLALAWSSAAAPSAPADTGANSDRC